MSVDSAWGLGVDDLNIAGCKLNGLLWQPGCTFSGMFLLTKNKFASVLLLLVLQTTIHVASAQPGRLSPPQLDLLVSRIALYPDPLLAQVLSASTYWTQIPNAATWANQHSYLTGDALAQAIQADNLQWDPSVLALLPFPSVLDMMAKDMAWTEQLGIAVLTQRAEVMDAVQRMRKRAMEYGYLQPNTYVNVVSDGGYIQILPYVPGVIYVPEYDPVVLFSRPPHGLAIGGAIRFGRGIAIGASFAPWGWATAGFVWPSHTLVFDRAPWGREWGNREVYRHPYAHPWVRAAGPRAERHELRRR
jgi:Protein of unknown function (DUF3300)